MRRRTDKPNQKENNKRTLFVIGRATEYRSDYIRVKESLQGPLTVSRGIVSIA